MPLYITSDSCLLCDVTIASPVFVHRRQHHLIPFRKAQLNPCTVSCFHSISDLECSLCLTPVSNRGMLHALRGKKALFFGYLYVQHAVYSNSYLKHSWTGETFLNFP